MVFNCTQFLSLEAGTTDAAFNSWNFPSLCPQVSFQIAHTTVLLDSCVQTWVHEGHRWTGEYLCICISGAFVIATLWSRECMRYRQNVWYYKPEVEEMRFWTNRRLYRCSQGFPNKSTVNSTMIVHHTCSTDYTENQQTTAEERPRNIQPVGKLLFISIIIYVLASMGLTSKINLIKNLFIQIKSCKFISFCWDMAMLKHDIE